MSWSCEVCYKGDGSDHDNCRMVGSIDYLSEKIRELNGKLDLLLEKLK